MNLPPLYPTSSQSSSSSTVTVAAEATVKAGDIIGEFLSLSERYALLKIKIKRAFSKASSCIDLQEVQDLGKDLCGLEPLPQEQATVVAEVTRLMKDSSILNLHMPRFLIKNLLKGNKLLQNEIHKLSLAVDRFKSSAKMVDLVDQMKKKQLVVDGHRTV